MKRNGYQGPTVEEILREWILARHPEIAPRTETLYQAAADRLSEAIGARQAATVDRKTIDAYRKARSVCARTANAELGCLVAALRHAVEVGSIPQMPDLGRWRLRVRESLPDYLTRAEFERLLAAASDPFKIALGLGRYCGLRVSESRRLRWADCDLVSGWITVRDSKSGSRRVAAPAVMVKMLESTRDRGTFVLEVRPGEPWSSRGFLTVVRRIFRAAGLDQRSPTHNYHLLRSTFAIRFAGSMHELQAAIGHRNLVTTARYVRSTPEGQRAGVEGGSLL